MKKNLYIDFDGVILDTIVPIYEMIKANDIELYRRNIEQKGINSEEDAKKIRDIVNSINWDNS